MGNKSRGAEKEKCGSRRVMWGPQTLTNEAVYEKERWGFHKSSVTPGKYYPADFLKIMGSVKPDHSLRMLNDHLFLTFVASECPKQVISNKGVLMGWVQVELVPRINACLNPDTLLILNTAHRAIPHIHSNSEEMKIYINITRGYWVPPV